MAPTLLPIQGVARNGIASDDVSANSHGGNGYLTSTLAHADLHGAGHLGVAPLDRVVMALKSGIASEIEHALSTLTFYSCNDPKLVNFNETPLIGNALISFFAKPYQQLLGGSGDNGSNGGNGSNLEVSRADLQASVESLLSLRNAAQDLHNQQWLCQAPGFRKSATDALKFLTSWFFSAKITRSYALDRASDTFRESLKHLLDILDPLTCFYIETPKNDPLFHQLLVVLAHTNDKYVLMVTLKCLQHLLFLGGADGTASRNPEEPDSNNCIDAVQQLHLHVIVRSLLVRDDELNYAVLSFLKQYLSSEALHAQYKTSVKQSQQHRLRKLVDAVSTVAAGNGSGLNGNGVGNGVGTGAGSVSADLSNLHVLFKQLPEFIVARLPLVDPSQVQQTLPLQLKKRSTYSGVPKSTAKLPDDLYSIILTFPEPLRATTWLRCCYEPYALATKSADSPAESSESPAGEVTQISLWKSYENQFEAIWKDRFNSKWPNLLPAVDFIKNVSSAFPSSEAMVVNVPATDTSQPARKFIIKGIQPRQFPVSVEIGNFEALRKNTAVAEEGGSVAAAVGDVDTEAFRSRADALVDSLLSASDGLTSPSDASAPWFSPINVLSRDILKILVSTLLEGDTEGKYRSVFRQYNKDWLPDLVYANPGLVDREYIDGRWLQYLL